MRLIVKAMKASGYPDILELAGTDLTFGDYLESTTRRLAVETKESDVLRPPFAFFWYKLPLVDEDFRRGMKASLQRAGVTDLSLACRAIIDASVNRSLRGRSQ